MKVLPIKRIYIQKASNAFSCSTSCATLTISVTKRSFHTVVSVIFRYAVSRCLHSLRCNSSNVITSVIVWKISLAAARDQRFPEFCVPPTGRRLSNESNGESISSDSRKENHLAPFPSSLPGRASTGSVSMSTVIPSTSTERSIRSHFL